MIIVINLSLDNIFICIEINIRTHAINAQNGFFIFLVASGNRVKKAWEPLSIRW